MPCPDPVALTQQLVRADTVNPPGREARCIEPLADLLSGAGFRCALDALAPGRPTLVARLGGRPDRAPIALTGHVDVVPLGTAPWRHDPFGAEIAGGRLYGRGASDMKSGVAAIVAAAIDLSDRLGDSAGVLLVLTAGEETGCEGAFHLARHPEGRALLGAAGALVVAEPTSNRPLVGHKGALWFEARTHGVTAHGSMPSLGDNAIYKAARAALTLEKFDFGTPPHPLMGAPTLNVGTIRGGLNINSVPDAAAIEVDVRSVAGQDHRQLMRCLCEALGPAITLAERLDVAPVYTAPDDPWMRRVQALAAARTGHAPAAGTVAFFTDAAALRPVLGMPPTVILGPGEPSQAHQTDEWCAVARIHEAHALYADLIRDWCGLPA